MIPQVVDGVIYPITGLLQSFIKEIHAEKDRKHQERMKELEIISNSNLRDQYVQQLLLDKFLAPIESAQHQIQNAAKHAQWLAEAFGYHYQDHGASQEEAKEISQELRLLAIKLSQVDSLYELKVVYQAATLFTHQISRFKHKERKYALERSIRKEILDVLNTCIAIEINFQNRLTIMGMN